MSDESISVAILLSSENIPKEIFSNSVDEYFGPQVEDFKNSSLSICVLSDKTGLEPSKINSALFLKSQWMFQTTLASNEIFEFKLTICENKSWTIILSEEFENRLIETFKIPCDKIIVVHLEWNKPHTVSVESLIDLYSMDESLIKSHYENQETSDLFKSLETITEDNFDDESLIDSLREESKKSNEDGKTENHDTDDSLETGKEYEKSTTKFNDHENKFNICENVLNKVKENISYSERNGDNNIYLKEKEDCNIPNKNSQRKVILLKKIQNILGVKSELDRIKSSNIMKDRNFINSTNLETYILAEKCKIENIHSFDVKTDHFCNASEIIFKKSIVLPCSLEVKELKLTVALELSLYLNVQVNICAGSFSHFFEDMHTQIINDNINYFNREHKIQFKNCEYDKVNSNNLVSDNIANNMEIQNNNENEEISLKYLNHHNAKSIVECSVPIEDVSLNTDVIVNILTQPYLCVLVLPCEEIQNIKFSKESKAMETFENVSVDFYHENLFQPKINNAENIYNEKEVLDLTYQSDKELGNIKSSVCPLLEPTNTNEFSILTDVNDLMNEQNLNSLNTKFNPENKLSRSDVDDGGKIDHLEASIKFSENVKIKNDFFSIRNDKMYVDEGQTITYDTPASVENIVVKFETLKENEINYPKIRTDKQKDQNRISGIVKQFEELNLSKDHKDSTREIKPKNIENIVDQENKLFKSLKENNSISKSSHKDSLTVVKDENKGNMNINQELQPELRINDDYKYPDSVTPTKVEHTLSQLKVYDVPFIDDDLFIKDTSFKDSTEKINIREFDNSLNIVNSIIKITPKASIETLQEIEIEKIKLSIETEEPVKKRKGLLDLCGCVGGRKRS